MLINMITTVTNGLSAPPLCVGLTDSLMNIVHRFVPDNWTPIMMIQLMSNGGFSFYPARDEAAAFLLCGRLLCRLERLVILHRHGADEFFLARLSKA